MPATTSTSTSMQHHHRRLLQLLLLSIATRSVLASPVSSPEIASKTGKITNSNASGGQQQQQQLQKSNLQDAHLNSLNAYATSYDIISNINAQNTNFKPSYKLPEMETNFTPIQSNPPTLANPTPVLMQYLPQTINEGGVQYLQLIPTRPLIVPISSYVSGGVPPQNVAYHQHQQQHQQHLTAENTLADYGGRSSALLTSVPGNSAPPAPSAMVDLPAQIPYALQTYTNNIQPYRNNYRINRETKPLNGPGSLSLNMNEYIPGPNDPPHQTYIRGRP